jgi:hypothetical protein
MPLKPETQAAYDKRIAYLTEKSGLNLRTDTTKVIEWLKAQPYMQGTRRTYITALIKMVGSTKDETPWHPYRVYLDTLWKLEHAEQKAQELTEREKANWLTWAEITANYEKVVAEADKIPAGTHTQEQQAVLRDAALFGLYTDLAPVRADYGCLEIRQVLRANEKGLKKGNYLVLGRKATDGSRPKMQVVIQSFKTDGASTAEPIVSDVPLRLKNVLLKFIGARTKDYVFNKGGIPEPDKSKPMTDQRFAEMLGERMHKWTGKTVGVNLYRHARITHERAGDKTAAVKGALAAKMGHSVATQENYRRVAEEAPPVVIPQQEFVAEHKKLAAVLVAPKSRRVAEAKKQLDELHTAVPATKPTKKK